MDGANLCVGQVTAQELRRRRWQRLTPTYATVVRAYGVWYNASKDEFSVVHAVEHPEQWVYRPLTVDDCFQFESRLLMRQWVETHLSLQYAQTIATCMGAPLAIGRFVLDFLLALSTVPPRTNTRITAKGVRKRQRRVDRRTRFLL
jgi:hypothetical protein